MFPCTSEAPERVAQAALDHEQPVGYGLTDDLEWLRTETEPTSTGVEYRGFRLDIYDTHRLGKRQRPLIAYRLAAQREDDEWDIIFTGDDYEPGMMTSSDSDQAIADLLGFLSVSPHDTDESYFHHHAAWQIAWVERHGEDLQVWSQHIEGADE